VRIDPLRARPRNNRDHTAPQPLTPRLDEGPGSDSEAGAVEDVLDVAVGIDDDGHLIPAASIGQRQ
jgi:hypothetical protein